MLAVPSAAVIEMPETAVCSDFLAKELSAADCADAVELDDIPVASSDTSDSAIDTDCPPATSLEQQVARLERRLDSFAESTMNVIKALPGA